MSADSIPDSPRSTGWLHPLLSNSDPRVIGRERDAAESTSTDRHLAGDPYADPLLSIVVDLLPIAVVVIDGTHVPIFTNPAADCVIQRGDIFHLGPNGALKLTDRTQRQMFEAYIDSIARTEAPPQDPSTVRFFVRRPSDPPVSITGSLCHRSDRPLAVVLFVRIPDATTQVPTVSLRALFNLTPAEADLANALVAGESLTEYCLRRSISVNTGKTQLKAVLAKTGAHRQAQLVRMLAI